MTKKKYPPSVKSQDVPAAANNVVEGKKIIHEIQHHQYSGPLPDPLTFSQYDDIVPGAADRILQMAELNARHMREMEEKHLQAQIDADIRRHKEVGRGQNYAICSVAMSFSVAVVALLLGYPSVAATICGVTIGGIVASFITGKVAGKQAVDDRQPPEKQ